MDFAIQVASAGRVGQDRAAVLSLDDQHLFLLADGAGGISGGGAAADLLIASAHGRRFESSLDCVGFLRNLDQNQESVGETTALIAFLSNGLISGASVGDSEAWLVADSGVVDITKDQRRKPLVGSGNADPVGFGPLPFVGRLVLGSDGLFKYVQHWHIRDLVRAHPVAEAAAALISAARLPSGALQDDVSVIVAS